MPACYLTRVVELGTGPTPSCVWSVRQLQGSLRRPSDWLSAAGKDVTGIPSRQAQWQSFCWNAAHRDLQSYLHTMPWHPEYWLPATLLNVAPSAGDRCIHQALALISLSQPKGWKSSRKARVDHHLLHIMTHRIDSGKVLAPAPRGTDWSPGHRHKNGVIHSASSRAGCDRCTGAVPLR